MIRKRESIMINADIELWFKTILNDNLVLRNYSLSREFPGWKYN